MKSKEELKESLLIEQKELKEKLIKLVEFLNSKDFFTLSENYRKVLQNQKIAMEFYLNILTMRLYQDVDSIAVPDMALLGLMTGMFSSSFSFQKSESVKELERKLDELKKSTPEWEDVE